MEISIEDFDKVEMRAGTVIAVDINKRARKPAYKVTIDLGDEIGVKILRYNYKRKAKRKTKWITELKTA